MATCSVKDCGRTATTRGWCPKHYMRWNKSTTWKDVPVLDAKGKPVMVKGAPKTKRVVDIPGDPEREVRDYRNQSLTCTVKEDGVECGKKAVSRGYCPKHYSRFRKHGDPTVVLPRGMARSSPQERFDSKYEKDENGCWVWTGATNGNGWATISIDGQAIMAHRYAYEAFIGPIPENGTVRRTCKNNRCVNPEHLLFVSSDPQQRFWGSVTKEDLGHWIWNRPGFVFRVDGETVSPRRYAYELTYGPIEGTLSVLCGQEKCVNPDHAGQAKDRFWQKVEKNDDGCWYWRGATLPTGYPHLSFEGRSVYAHHLAYQWSGGVVEDGNVLVHIDACGHLNCVKPKHLTQISYQALAQRRTAKAGV